MQIILIIVSVLMFIVTITVPTVIIAQLDDGKWYHVIGVLLIIFVLFTSLMCTIDKTTEFNSPKPIDVYRGKTTLKITYVDSIPQDTTVIFK